jgi:hypothetical protein
MRFTDDDLKRWESLLDSDVTIEITPEHKPLMRAFVARLIAAEDLIGLEDPTSAFDEAYKKWCDISGHVTE